MAGKPDPLRSIELRYAEGFGDIEQAAEDVGTLLDRVGRLEQFVHELQDVLYAQGEYVTKQSIRRLMDRLGIR